MKINIEKFVEAYIQKAFNVSKENSTLEVFDDKIRASVSKKMSLSKGFITHMHHAFHWELFCNKDSILEYVQAHKNGKNNFVRFKTPYKNEDIKNLSNLILNKYKTYLRGRIDSYLEQIPVLS